MMHEPALTQHEAVAAYSQNQVLEITSTAHKAASHLLNEIAACLQPGITEAELRELAQSVFERHGIQKQWHRPYIYFGPHTTLNAYDHKPKDEILTLRETDIAYIDIGPVLPMQGLEVEGDIGRTYVFGEHALFHQLRQASDKIFEDACAYWRKNQPTGIELYRYIDRLTQQAGLVFNLEPAGHLIGSFPHQGWKHGLNTYPYQPEPGIWVLEIQLRHPTEPYGAFREAMLI
jgi:Xaa-Pro aminopeptidase